MFLDCILIFLILFILFFYCRLCNKESFLILDKYLRYWPGDRFSIGKDYFVDFEGTPNNDNNYNIYIGRLSMRTNSVHNSGIMATHINNILYLNKANNFIWRCHLATRFNEYAQQYENMAEILTSHLLNPHRFVPVLAVVHPFGLLKEFLCRK